jgi:hypothetical protein
MLAMATSLRIDAQGGLLLCDERKGRPLEPGSSLAGCGETLRSLFDKLRAIGGNAENQVFIPIVVSVSNHKLSFSACQTVRVTVLIAAFTLAAISRGNDFI